MAMLLKREYSLVALLVELQTRGNDAAVSLTLEFTEDRQARKAWSTIVTADQMGLDAGISDRSGAGTDNVTLPADIVNALRDHLDEATYDGPLWLHLIKPYGTLGSVRWEQLLAPCQRPVLRLPDALAPVPVELPQTLDVVLCASRPRAKEFFDLPDYLARMAETLVHAVLDRTVRVHVFADLECMQPVRAQMSALKLLDTAVFVHDPQLVAHRESVRSPRNTDSNTTATQVALSPWLQWMADALGGKPVDVIHFLCHGYLAECSGSLAFAQSPISNNDPSWSRFVGAGELGRFLTSSGAWSVAFTSPQGNYSPAGLRLLADQFAQVRAGPVMHHDSELDRDFAQLGAAYRFLYSNHPEKAPSMTAVALCCQPALVTGERAKLRHGAVLRNAAQEMPAMKRDVDDVPQTVPLDDTVESSDLSESATEMPGWIASAHRFIEQKEYEIQRSRISNQRFTSRSGRDLDGIARGVDEIKTALERLNKKGML